MSKKALVVMCLWKRHSNLVGIVEALNRQTRKDFKFVLWDNGDDKEFAKRLFSERARFDFEIIESENVGGMGRFYAVERMADDHDIAIFFDDDQVPGEGFVDFMVSAYEPRTIKSNYCFRIRNNENYWDRERVYAGGCDINYCGTCGMVLDAGIFRVPGSMDCPPKYSFIEDLWLSFFAQHELGWRLVSIDAPLSNLEDGKGQWVMLREKKSEFLSFLVRKKKWDLGKTC